MDLYSSCSSLGLSETASLFIQSSVYLGLVDIRNTDYFTGVLRIVYVYMKMLLRH